MTQPRVSARSQSPSQRTRGFGLLDGVLALALAAGATTTGVIAYNTASDDQKANATLEQFYAIRDTVVVSYGDTPQAMANVTTAALAGGGRVPGTTSATTILSPYGNPVTVSKGDPAGLQVGYTVHLGGMSSGTCIKLLNAIGSDPGVTGVEFGSPRVGLYYFGQNPQFTQGEISYYCKLYNPIQVHLSINATGAVTAGVSGSSHVTAGPVHVGETTLTDINLPDAVISPAPLPGYTPSAPPSLSETVDPAHPETTILTLNNVADGLSVASNEDINHEAGFAFSTTITAKPGEVIDSITGNLNPVFSNTDCHVDCAIHLFVSGYQPGTNHIIYNYQALAYPDSSSATGYRVFASMGTNGNWMTPNGVHASSMDVKVTLETFSQGVGNTTSFSGPPTLSVKTRSAP